MDGFDFYINVNGRPVTINPFSITPKHGRLLNEKVTEARVNAFIQGKVAPLPGESKEDWLKRYNEQIKEENEKRSDEEASQFIKRSVTTTVLDDNYFFMKNVLNAIFEVFGKEQITQETFDTLSIVEANNFIARIMKKAKCPCEIQEEVLPTF